MTQQLDREEAVFTGKVGEWRETHLGEFVLIKDDDVLGFYPGLNEAFREGTSRFGLQPFLVKQIVPDDVVNVSLYGQRLHAS